jgi:hypothetical protein
MMILEHHDYVMHCFGSYNYTTLAAPITHAQNVQIMHKHFLGLPLTSQGMHPNTAKAARKETYCSLFKAPLCQSQGEGTLSFCHI